MNEKFFDLSMEKQDKIMNAALKVFTKNRYKHASTDVIIKEAGISKGLLFHYFTSKAGLYSFLYAYCVKYVSMERNQMISAEETNYFNLLIQIEQSNLRATRKYPYIALFLDRVLEEVDTEAEALICEKREEYLGETNRILMQSSQENRFSQTTDVVRADEIMQYTLSGIRCRFRSQQEMQPEGLIQSLCESIRYFEQLFGRKD